MNKILVLMMRKRELASHTWLTGHYIGSSVPVYKQASPGAYRENSALDSIQKDDEYTH